jgi:hypothetical protein
MLPESETARKRTNKPERCSTVWYCSITGMFVGLCLCVLAVDYENLATFPLEKMGNSVSFLWFHKISKLLKRRNTYSVLRQMGMSIKVTQDLL